MTLIFNPNKHWKGCRFVRGYLDSTQDPLKPRPVIEAGWQKNPEFLYDGVFLPHESKNLRTIGKTLDNMELVIEPGEKSDGTGKSKDEWEEIAENNISKYGFTAEKWSHNGKASHYHLRNWKGVTEDNRIAVFKFLTKLICVDGFDTSLCGEWKLIAVEDRPHWKDSTGTRVKRFVKVVNSDGKNVLSSDLLNRVENAVKNLEKNTVKLNKYNINEDIQKLYNLLITHEFPSGNRQLTVVKNLVIGLRESKISEETKRSMILEVANKQRMNPSSFDGFHGMEGFNHSEINKFCEDNNVEPLYKFMPILLKEFDECTTDKEKEKIVANMFKAIKRENPLTQSKYEEEIQKKLNMKKSQYVELKRNYISPEKPHYEYARELMDKYGFISLSPKNIFVYHDGVYRENGVQIITNEMEELNEACNDKKLIDEVINAIYRLTIQTDGRTIEEADSKYICLNNGILNTETMEIHPHNNEFVFLSKLPVNYNPEADKEIVYEYFRSIVKEDDVGTLAELFGWVLEPKYYPENIVFLSGGGSNGKSKFISIFRKFLGTDNTASVNLAQLQKDKFKPAELFGKYANLISETSNRVFEDTDLIKTLTGGDDITAERKGKDPFKFVNRAKIINSCNEIPRTNDTSDGLFRRMIVIDFPFIFNKDNSKVNIVEQMTTDEILSGVLLVALEGLKRLREGKCFTNRGDTQKNAERLMDRSNIMDDFLNLYEASYNGSVTSDELTDTYNNLCMERNIPAKHSIQTIYAEIKRRFPTSVKTRWREDNDKRPHGIKGIRLFNDTEDIPERPQNKTFGSFGGEE